MKNLLFIVLATFSLTSCDDDTNLPAPYYSIEGKWIWSPSDNRADANTMYEFVDGIRYTYYCITCPGDDAYWNSLETTDAIPGTNPYTFENDTLRVDLHLEMNWLHSLHLNVMVVNFLWTVNLVTYGD